ncbi:MAG: helix-turn-helix transcriptional regulator [Dokdonia sp.]
MIGTYIRACRKRRNLLLRELAASLNMDSAMLSKMERGLRPFRKEDLAILSEVLKESYDFLYTKWLADKALRATDDKLHQTKALELALSLCKNQN